MATVWGILQKDQDYYCNSVWDVLQPNKEYCNNRVWDITTKQGIL